MDLPRNSFKKSIRCGERQIGLWCTLMSCITTEIAAGAGFDWLLIDTEHTPASDGEVLQQLQVCAAYPVSPVVRPAWNDPVRIKRLLDIGAQTLLVPYVQDRTEAERAVAAVRYPPGGMRGVAGSMRASRFGRVPGYFAACEEELCVLVQIESRKALDHLEEIAATDGVDGVFIGPADLAANMGHGSDPGHEEVREAIEGAIARIAAAGKPSGILAVSEAAAHRYIELGATFAAVGVDASILARHTAELARRFKEPNPSDQ